MTKDEIKRIVEQVVAEPQPAAPVRRKRRTQEPQGSFQGDPLDDPNNPNVPKGGRWGVTGMAQSPEQFRQRVGSPGLNQSLGGKIKPDEVQKLSQRIDQIQPDEIIAYSRGAPLYNSAVQAGMKWRPSSITYMAPSSYRNWANAAVPKAGSGKVTTGDKDSVVPMKQAAKNAVDAGVPMYVLPGFSHVGIMYSQGDVTPGGFEVDPEGIVNDPEMPDWGRSGMAAGGKDGPDMIRQAERIKQHVKEERALRRLLNLILNENF